jgi:hypothetical protein
MESIDSKRRPFKDIFNLENKESPLVLDQASKEAVERLFSRVSPKTDGLRAMCLRPHCQHGAYIGLTSKHPTFLS